jgi:hypothetical protein
MKKMVIIVVAATIAVSLLIVAASMGLADLIMTGCFT